MKKSYDLMAISEHWLEEAEQIYARVLEKAGEVIADSMYSGKEMDKEIPYLFQAQDGVGVISIKGSLTNRNSPWNRYFGATSYDDIRAALVYASEDETVKRILLDISSGGGQVAGMNGVGVLIKEIDKTKPVYAFTETNMASAAYYIGSFARKIYATEMATLGSLGVISTLVTQEKAMEQEGYTPHIIRSGKFKQIGHPFEALSAAGEKYLQDRIDYMYSLMLNDIAGNRGEEPEAFDKKAGMGREFIGQQAKDVGLVDKIMSFDNVMSALIASITADKEKDMHKKYSKTVMAAAAAGGITLEAAAEQLGEKPEIVETPETTEQAESAEDTTAAEEGQETEASAGKDQEEEAAQAQKPAESELVAYLKAELKEKNEKIDTLTGQLAANKVDPEIMKGLKEIAASSIARMRVPLNLAAVDMANWDAAALISEYTAVSATFASAFKIGGVADSAAQAAQKKTDKTAVKITALEDRRMKAVGV